MRNCRVTAVLPGHPIRLESTFATCFHEGREVSFAVRERVKGILIAIDPERRSLERGTTSKSGGVDGCSIGTLIT